MASRKLVSAESAFSTAKKRSILMEEGLRRLRNYSPALSWKDKVFFLNRFSSDLKYSGHTPSFRKTVLRRILARYEVDLSNHLEGIKTMYRTRQERILMKSRGIISNQRDTWFRSGGFTSTLTVPATPNGLLAELVRKNLTKGRQPPGTKTKVIEDGGVGAHCGVVKSNPFPRDKCERDCVLCLQKEGEGVTLVCDKNNIGYEGKCSRCPTQFTYIGETSRTGYTRLREHLADYRSAARDRLPAQLQQAGGDAGENPRNVKSWMWEHVRDVHGGAVGENNGMNDYQMKVTGRFRKCLDRQVDEDLRMQEFEGGGGVLLNSKCEYFTPKSIQPVFRQL